MEHLTLTPTRPYLVRAIFEWLEDNHLTPYIMVDATQPNVSVPTEFVQDGRIVLNIATQATGNLTIDNDYVHFSARFGGVSREIWVPMPALMGIYAKENSQGMFFESSEYETYSPETNDKTMTNSTAERNNTRPKRANSAGLKILD